jgi:hypothetical protein
MALFTLDTLTADGQTASIPWFGKGRGFGSIYPVGSLGGGTFTLEASIDNATFITVSGSEITTNETKTFQLLSGDNQNPIYLRGSITGSTAPSLTVTIANEVPIDG